MEKRGLSLLFFVVLFPILISGCAQTACLPDETKDCGINLGVCGKGISVCNKEGQWGPCLDDAGNEVKLVGGEEICDNNLDDNCDGKVDDGCIMCKDSDKDKFFKYDLEACPTGNDCDDSDSKIYPRAREICINNKDDDCDKETDEGCNCMDNDKDGYPVSNPISCQTGTDCDDTKSAINPGQKEICNNGLDDDCNPNTEDDCKCIDSDILKEPYYERGTCSRGAEEFIDQCRDTAMLEEYSCENNVCKQELVSCPTSCVEGKCTKGEVDFRVKVNTKGKPAGTDDIIARFSLFKEKLNSLGLHKGIAEKSELLYGKEKEQIGELAGNKQTSYDLTIKNSASNSLFEKILFTIPNMQNGTSLGKYDKVTYAKFSITLVKEDLSDSMKDRKKYVMMPSGYADVIAINAEDLDAKDVLALPDGTKTYKVWIAKGLVDKGQNKYDIFYYNNDVKDERYYGSFDASKAGEKIASINYGKTTGETIEIVSEGIKDIYS